MDMLKISMLSLTIFYFSFSFALFIIRFWYMTVAAVCTRSVTHCSQKLYASITVVTESRTAVVGSRPSVIEWRLINCYTNRLPDTAAPLPWASVGRTTSLSTSANATCPAASPDELRSLRCTCALIYAQLRVNSQCNDDIGFCGNTVRNYCFYFYSNLHNTTANVLLNANLCYLIVNWVTRLRSVCSTSSKTTVIDTAFSLWKI